jgi:single-strand DNA-binding protein
MKTMQNAVALGGNLGTNVEVTQIGSGKRIARTTLATNEYYKDSSGTPQKRTLWHDLIAWDGIADWMQRDLTKGAFVVVHGKLINREYIDHNGTTRTISEIDVREFSFMRPVAQPAIQTAA